VDQNVVKVVFGIVRVGTAVGTGVAALPRAALAAVAVDGAAGVDRVATARNEAGDSKTRLQGSGDLSADKLREDKASVHLRLLPAAESNSDRPVGGHVDDARFHHGTSSR